MGCAQTPTALGPGAPRVDAGPGPTTKAPRVAPAGAAVSITTRAGPWALRDAPTVRGHLCGNGNSPGYGGSDGPVSPHCAAELPARGGGEHVVAAGPGASGRGSHREEARASPACPPLFRHSPSPASAGQIPGGRSEPQRWPLRRSQDTATRSSDAGALLEPGLLQTLASADSAPPSPRPPRPSPATLTVAPERRKLNGSIWLWHRRGAASSEDNCPKPRGSGGISLQSSCS